MSMMGSEGGSKGAAAIVLAVVAVVVGAIGLFSGISAKGKIDAVTDQAEQLAVQVKALSDENAQISSQVRSLFDQTRQSLMAMGTQVERLTVEVNRMTNRPAQQVAAVAGARTGAAGAAGAAQTGAGATSPTASGKTYTVKSGDILGRIAKAHNVSEAALLKANPDVDPRRMKVGQKIKIP